MAQTKAWNDVAKANMKELTQHDTMSDWQDFMEAPRCSSDLQHSQVLLCQKMPKMGDRFLKRPTDDEVAKVISNKRPQEIVPATRADKERADVREHVGNEQPQHAAEVQHKEKISTSRENPGPISKKKRKHAEAGSAVDSKKGNAFIKEACTQPL